MRAWRRYEKNTNVLPGDTSSYIILIMDYGQTYTGHGVSDRRRPIQSTVGGDVTL